MVSTVSYNDEHVVNIVKWLQFGITNKTDVTNVLIGVYSRNKRSFKATDACFQKDRLLNKWDISWTIGVLE